MTEKLQQLKMPEVEALCQSLIQQAHGPSELDWAELERALQPSAGRDVLRRAAQQITEPARERWRRTLGLRRTWVYGSGHLGESLARAGQRADDIALHEAIDEINLHLGFVAARRTHTTTLQLSCLTQSRIPKPLTAETAEMSPDSLKLVLGGCRISNHQLHRLLQIPGGTEALSVILIERAVIEQVKIANSDAIKTREQDKEDSQEAICRFILLVIGVILLAAVTAILGGLQAITMLVTLTAITLIIAEYILLTRIGERIAGIAEAFKNVKEYAKTEPVATLQATYRLNPGTSAVSVRFTEVKELADSAGASAEPSAEPALPPRARALIYERRRERQLLERRLQEAHTLSTSEMRHTRERAQEASLKLQQQIARLDGEIGLLHAEAEEEQLRAIERDLTVAERQR